MLTINSKARTILLLVVAGFVVVALVALLRIFMTMEAARNEAKAQQQQREALSLAITNAASQSKAKTGTIIDLSKITTFSSSSWFSPKTEKLFNMWSTPGRRMIFPI